MLLFLFRDCRRTVVWGFQAVLCGDTKWGPQQMTYFVIAWSQCEAGEGLRHAIGLQPQHCHLLAEWAWQVAQLLWTLVSTSEIIMLTLPGSCKNCARKWPQNFLAHVPGTQMIFLCLPFISFKLFPKSSTGLYRKVTGLKLLPPVLPALLLPASQVLPSGLDPQTQRFPFPCSLLNWCPQGSRHLAPCFSNSNSEIVCSLEIPVYASPGGQPAERAHRVRTAREHRVVFWWKAQGAGPLGPVWGRVTWDDEGKVRTWKLGGYTSKGQALGRCLIGCGKTEEKRIIVELAERSGCGGENKCLQDQAAYIVSGKGEGGCREWWGLWRTPGYRLRGLYYFLSFLVTIWLNFQVVNFI